MNTLFWILLAVIVGYIGGWRLAHTTVADECEKLGKFYVGKTVYECSAIKNQTPITKE